MYMYFTVIPFLLGARMFVNDTKEWNFGPEYIFTLQRDLRAHMGYDIYIDERVTAAVKCRLNVSFRSVQNVLFCRASNITVLNITQENSEKIIDDSRIIGIIPDQLFKIEFSRQGVQNYKLKAMKKEQYYDNIITDIIDQFNIGTDLSAARDSMKNYDKWMCSPSVIFIFTQNKENTTKATSCDMAGSITYVSHCYNKGREFPKNSQISTEISKEVQKNKTEFDFHLKLLPISYADPVNKTFWIERSRNACTHQPQYLMLFNDKWEIYDIEEYSTSMKISDKNQKFSTRTRLYGAIHFPSSIIYKFWQDVRLNLFRIRPAREKLNTAEYE